MIQVPACIPPLDSRPTIYLPEILPNFYPVKKISSDPIDIEWLDVDATHVLTRFGKPFILRLKRDVNSAQAKAY